MPKRLLQVGVRRSGLHAVRRWVVNYLDLYGKHDDFGIGPNAKPLVNVSWFVWPGEHTDEMVLDACARHPIVTLESCPLAAAVEYARLTGRRLLLCIRSLLGWFASSWLLARRLGEPLVLGSHREMVQIWRDHVAHQGSNVVKLHYEPWLLDANYRYQIATDLGAVNPRRCPLPPKPADTPERKLDDPVELALRWKGLAGCQEFFNDLRACL